MQSSRGRVLAQDAVAPASFHRDTSVVELDGLEDAAEIVRPQRSGLGHFHLVLVHDFQVEEGLVGGQQDPIGGVLYIELLDTVRDASIYLEEFARTMISTEEFHQLELTKMLRDFGE